MDKTIKIPKAHLKIIEESTLEFWERLSDKFQNLPDSADPHDDRFLITSSIFVTLLVQFSGEFQKGKRKEGLQILLSKIIENFDEENFFKN